MPDYPKAIKKVQAENPDIKPSISEAGPITRLFANRKARAMVNPFTGNVSYFPDRMAQMSDPEAENVFAHELQHTRQIQGMNLFQRVMAVGKAALFDEPYNQRPRELEAFQAEKDRNQRLGYNLPDPHTGARDINLPPEVPQMPPMSKRRQNMAMFVNDRQR